MIRPLTVVRAPEDLRDRPPTELVIAVPAGPLRVLVDLAGLEDRLDAFESPVVVADGPAFAAAGPAEDVADLLAGNVVDAEIDETGLVFHHTDAGPLIPTAAGPVHPGTGVAPAVLLGHEAPPSPDLVTLGRLLDPCRAPIPGWSEIASEIVQMRFWSPDRCAELVIAAEAFGSWGRDETDPVPGDEVPLRSIAPALLARLEADLDAWVVPQLTQHWPLFGWSGVFDAFVIRYGADPTAPPNLPLHHDIAQVSASVRLNDGYEGGRLEFPRQGWANDGVAVGDLIAWPSLVTHPHGSTPVTAGVRYALTIWLALPELPLPGL